MNASFTSSLADRLADRTLLRASNLIGGEWVPARSGESHSVINPGTGAVIAQVPASIGVDAEAAVAAAQAAFVDWSGRTAKERAVLLKEWHALIMANQDDLGLILATEQGKPLAESIGEVAYGAGFVEWFAEEGKRIYGDVIPAHVSDKRIVVVRQAIGVASLITPWNFPSAMVTRKVGPALAAGCTLVLKPAEDTPLSALALGELAMRAGIPAGVFNIVTTALPQAVGEVLTSHPDVRKLSFTGSTRVGKLLMAQCASTVKRVSLELGGNAAFIIFDDADLDAALRGLIACKFRNTGQTCISANRIFVQSGVFDRFSEMLVQAVGTLRVGDALEPGAQLGPLINVQALEKVQALVADAHNRGAHLHTGGVLHEHGGLFYEPTVMSGMTPQMRAWTEEIFGPVAMLSRFEDESEAVALANDTRHGLAGYFYTRDVARAWRVAEAMEVGMVGVNEGFISTEVAPFGGVKESGLGREGSKYGIDDYVETKYICFGGIN